MGYVRMRMAKADDKDFEMTLAFLKACEGLWSKRSYQLSEPAEEWELWDDDDEDKKNLLALRARIAKEDGISENDVDNRIIIYEYIRRMYKKCDNGWARVYWAAHILIGAICDPQKEYLDYSPYITDVHIAPEQ